MSAIGFDLPASLEREPSREKHNGDAHLQHHFATIEQQADTSKIGMWLFLATEILLFGGLFVGFALMQARYSAEFLEAHTHLVRWQGALNTIVLLVSSFTMVMAVDSAKKNKRTAAEYYLLATIACAFIFLVVKYFEYSHKFEEGWLPGAYYHAIGDEFPASRGYATFFSFYFMMTGLHGIHIVGGIVALSWILRRVRRGEFSSVYYTPIDLVGLYWHLVDMIWIYLFPDVLLDSMKSLFRTLTLIVAVCLGAFAYFYFRGPAIAAPAAIVVDKSPERVERGKYLFTHLCDCDFCHSEQDPTRLALPVIESTRGQGKLMADTDLPGQIYAANITPDVETGIGSWTDGEKIRAIREGVDKDGQALFPIMPYRFYRYMSDEDVQSIVAFLDTIPPIKHKVPDTKVNFPDSMWMKGDPRPVTEPYKMPDPGNKVRYGEYLATIAHCEVCHTPHPNLKEDYTLRFAGGRHFVTPFGDVYSANITPDPATGIGDWDLDRFKTRLKIYLRYETKEGPPVATPDTFTMMPYPAFAHLSDYDMEAIYAYLMSRTPINHRVEPHMGVPKRDEP